MGTIAIGTIAMFVSFIAGIMGAFFLGVKIGHDRGYLEGTEDTQKTLAEIYESGIKERKMIDKEIDTDCPWK